MLKKVIFTVLVLLSFLAVSVIVSICFGSSFYSIFDIAAILLHSGEFSSEYTIITDIRMPRTCAALLTGGALAAAGTAFQALLRNPLADPYIVGTSSGASLGAAAAVVFHITVTGFLSPVILFAFAGSAAVMFCVYTVSLRSGRLSVESFLLS